MALQYIPTSGWTIDYYQGGKNTGWAPQAGQSVRGNCSRKESPQDEASGGDLVRSQRWEATDVPDLGSSSIRPRRIKDEPKGARPLRRSRRSLMALASVGPGGGLLDPRRRECSLAGLAKSLTAGYLALSAVYQQLEGFVQFFLALQNNEASPSLFLSSFSSHPSSLFLPFFPLFLLPFHLTSLPPSLPPPSLYLFSPCSPFRLSFLRPISPSSLPPLLSTTLSPSLLYSFRPSILVPLPFLPLFLSFLSLSFPPPIFPYPFFLALPPSLHSFASSFPFPRLFPFLSPSPYPSLPFPPSIHPSLSIHPFLSLSVLPPFLFLLIPFPSSSISLPSHTFPFFLLPSLPLLLQSPFPLLPSIQSSIPLSLPFCPPSPFPSLFLFLHSSLPASPPRPFLLSSLPLFVLSLPSLLTPFSLPLSPFPSLPSFSFIHFSLSTNLCKFLVFLFLLSAFLLEGSDDIGRF
ncbi:hypothetical protein C7M84_006613 [Penaeus vannamei]|uniref:Uncharacterized protein n=1 Tax=Penaeus vannamei TaxID=6689 RepID=A0A3R7M8E6_PENVA|nr:hypothetical protein C7M84_006613 [Penaeus vannamei]